MADSDSTPPDKKRQEPPPIEFVRPGEAQPAPPPEQRPSAAWVTRPEDYQRPQYAQPPAPPRTQAQGTGTRPRIAGILLILAGAISAAVLIANSMTIPSIADFQNATSDASLYALAQMCSIMVIWGQAIIVLAGIMSFRGLNWRMTMSAAFFAMILLGGFAIAFLDPISIVAAAVGVIGFALTVTSRAEFVS